MLKNYSFAKDDEVLLCKKIKMQLGKPEITAENRVALLAEIEYLNGPIRRALIEEVLIDLNSGLASLLRGYFIKEMREKFEVTVPNKAPLARYGWVEATLNGELRMYDPSVPEDEREYKEIPTTTVEKVKAVFVVETNRKAIGQIETILKDFLQNCRGSFKQLPIDEILVLKTQTEIIISKIDRGQLIRENFGEGEYLDAGYLKKARHPKTENKERDLFNEFDLLKQNFAG
jgi:hypothetical protein